MRKFIIILAFVIPLIGFSQEQEKKKFGVKFSGFVKTDIFFDSRQTIDARAGHFLLYPKNESLDFSGADINAASKFNILSIQTRMRVMITGPDVWGAKTSGLVEGAFFGNIGTDINGFRLRLAFVKLTWPTSELLIGQFWHPMFVTRCFPGTVSFNTGVPFQPFSRNPQVRFTKRLGNFNIIASAMEQVDFVSTGPLGPGSRYLINSALPEFNLRFEYKSDKFYAGLGGNYKRLKPRLSVSQSIPMNPEGYKFKTDNYASGVSIFGYVNVPTKPITLRFYGVLGQMMTSMTMIGGYAETEYETTTIQDAPAFDVVSDYKYSPLSTMSVWFDCNTNGKTWQVGLFAGYSQNLGSNDTIVGNVYARGSDINYAYRISPRFVYNAGKFRIAPELEYTVAAYATKNDAGDINIDDLGKISDSKEIGNFRFLLGCYFFF